MQQFCNKRPQVGERHAASSGRAKYTQLKLCFVTRRVAVVQNVHN